MRPNGFSLIELLVVLAIIGMLAKIGTQKFVYAQVKAKRTEAVHMLRQIMKQYKIAIATAESPGSPTCALDPRKCVTENDYPLTCIGASCDGMDWFGHRLTGNTADCYDNLIGFKVEGCQNLRYEYDRFNGAGGEKYIVARSARPFGLNWVLAGCRPDLVIAKVSTGEVRICHDAFSQCKDTVFYNSPLEYTQNIINACGFS